MAEQWGDMVIGLDKLCEPQLSSVLEDLKKYNIQELKDTYKRITDAGPKETKEVSPYPHILSAKGGSDSKEWTKKGHEMIRKGKAACLLLGAGEGTRLAFPHPKGMFSPSLPSSLPLFALQAQRLRKLAELARKEGEEEGKGVVWYIMVNEKKEEEVKNFFEENDYFGVEKEDVVFFLQESQPCYSPDGKIHISPNKEKLLCAPNGNGGVYRGMVKGKVLEDMRKRGVEYVFAYGVDNLLVRVVDPLFLGCLAMQGADVGAKVVTKTNPHERVGVLVNSGGVPAVVEYSEITKEDAESVDEKTGKLKFNAGNICIHAFSVSFLEKLAEMRVWETMELHLSKKKGTIYHPATDSLIETEVWKPEFFIFDVFCHAQKLVALEVERGEEFAAIKNKEGNDSPATARELLSALHRSWIENNGGIVIGDDICEVSPLVSYAGEGLSFVKGKTYHTPVYLQKEE